MPRNMRLRRTLLALLPSEGAGEEGPPRPFQEMSSHLDLDVLLVIQNVLVHRDARQNLLTETFDGLKLKFEHQSSRRLNGQVALTQPLLGS